MSRSEARRHSAIAAWIGARGHGTRLERLIGGAARAKVVEPAVTFDAHAARCLVRVGGASIEVLGGSRGVRAIAQRMLGGPEELAAPRPLGVVEQSLWSLVVATALEDLDVPGEVWPALDVQVDRRDRDSSSPLLTSPATLVRVGLEVSARDLAVSVELRVPAELELRAPPMRSAPPWFDRVALEVPVVLGRCALPVHALAGLGIRDLVTLDPPARPPEAGRFRAGGQTGAELALLGGAIGLRGATGAVVAEVATGYVRRDMSLPDDAHVELTVALGTTQLSLRQVMGLAIGQIVPLGRPLAGPFEVRAEGRVVGRGELVDVDGELAVRIVSLGD